jgi:hypothetical protein
MHIEAEEQLDHRVEVDGLPLLHTLCLIHAYRALSTLQYINNYQAGGGGGVGAVMCGYSVLRYTVVDF